MGCSKMNYQGPNLETRFTRWNVTDGANSRTTNTNLPFCVDQGAVVTLREKSKPGSRVSDQIKQEIKTV